MSKEKETQKKEKPQVGFYIGFILLAVVFAIYMEIHKNTLMGWLIGLLIFVCYFSFNKQWIRQQKWYIRLLSFVVVAVLLFSSSNLSNPPYKQVPAVDVKNPQVTGVRHVKQGDLTGVYSRDEKVEVYAGIPYAKPPVGDLRWKEPQESENWKGIRACDTFAPMSMQQESDPLFTAGSQIVGYHNFKITTKDNYKEARSEDSLYLNVWKPANSDGKKLPVLVYIHGGSLNSGQSYYGDYNGETLAKKGVVVVTIAYRLGVFGYLASDELAEESENHTTGNYGLLDQIQALKWMNENIASFDGDPDNITIAGESAGASSVNAICVSPLAKGLFKRAVAESSGICAVQPYHTFRTIEDAKKVSKDILKEFDCKSIEDLRKIPAEQLVETGYSNNEMTVDGYAITEQPYLTYEKGENNEEAILGGYNANEAYVFLMFGNHVNLDNYEQSLEQVVGKDRVKDVVKLYPAKTDEEAKQNYNDIMGWAWFGYSHYAWSKLMTAEERPAYMYYFNKENDSIGTWHAGEMPYMYGNLFRNAKNYDKSDEKLSEIMQNYLVNYVKTGNPNGKGLPQWKTVAEEPKKVMSFGEKIGMIEEKHLPFFKVVDSYMESLK